MSSPASEVLLGVFVDISAPVSTIFRFSDSYHASSVPESGIEMLHRLFATLASLLLTDDKFWVFSRVAFIAMNSSILVAVFNRRFRSPTEESHSRSLALRRALSRSLSISL